MFKKLSLLWELKMTYKLHSNHLLWVYIVHYERRKSQPSTRLSENFPYSPKIDVHHQSIKHWMRTEEEGKMWWMWNDSDKRFTLMSSTQIIYTRLFRVYATTYNFIFITSTCSTLTKIYSTCPLNSIMHMNGYGRWNYISFVALSIIKSY